eukprot:3375369-Rhodomonas_salina.1
MTTDVVVGRALAKEPIDHPSLYNTRGGHGKTPKDFKTTTWNCRTRCCCPAYHFEVKAGSMAGTRTEEAV